MTLHDTKLETRIIKQVIKDLLAVPYTITVWDGEEETLSYSSDPALIFKAMRTTDGDHLFVYSKSDRVNAVYKGMGWVCLVYGNDPWEIISDYTTNLEPHLHNSFDLAEKIEKEHT